MAANARRFYRFPTGLDWVAFGSGEAATEPPALAAGVTFGAPLEITNQWRGSDRFPLDLPGVTVVWSPRHGWYLYGPAHADEFSGYQAAPPTFGNVHPNGRICWGHGDTRADPGDVRGCIAAFFGSPFNADLTSGYPETRECPAVAAWERGRHMAGSEAAQHAYDTWAPPADEPADPMRVLPEPPPGFAVDNRVNVTLFLNAGDLLPEGSPWAWPTLAALVGDPGRVHGLPVAARRAFVNAALHVRNYVSDTITGSGTRPDAWTGSVLGGLTRRSNVLRDAYRAYADACVSLCQRCGVIPPDVADAADHAVASAVWIGTYVAWHNATTSAPDSRRTAAAEAARLAAVAAYDAANPRPEPFAGGDPLAEYYAGGWRRDVTRSLSIVGMETGPWALHRGQFAGYFIGTGGVYLVADTPAGFVARHSHRDEYARVTVETRGNVEYATPEDTTHAGI